MRTRIVLSLVLFGVAAVPVAHAAVPPPHPAAPPFHIAAPQFHAAGAAGPGIIGGPAKQQAGIVIGQPIMKHH